MSKINVKSQVTDLLLLPHDVLLSLPRIQMTGNQELAIENHNGILEYSDESIRVLTASGKISIIGHDLNIRFIGTKDIHILGRVTSLIFDSDDTLAKPEIPK